MTTEPRGSGSRPNRLDIGIALAVGFFTASAAAAQTYELVHSFRNSGQPAPLGKASQSRLTPAPDGYFYGTTCWGGSNGVGTIFRMDSSGGVTTLHSFAYADGAVPLAGLVRASDGNFYGTASLGGAHNRGTVFRMDSSGSVSRLHSFDGTDGQYPLAALIQASDDKFYGTTSDGGAHLVGSVFRIDSSGDFALLHSFDRFVDGAVPAAELLEANGKLYGSTSEGGANDEGTLFHIDFAGDLQSIHVFHNADGRRPIGALIQAASGDLYGTTMQGGTYDGTIFRLDASDELTTVHSLNPQTDGSYPAAPLIEGSDGAFYGTTAGGSGGLEAGTVFRVDVAGDFTLLHTFLGTDGARPAVGLVEASDGNFYGATSSTSIFPFPEAIAGTLFRMTAAGALTTLHRFGWSDGADPEAALTQATDGSFYGTTGQGGEGNAGTIFKLDSSVSVTRLHTFNGLDGNFPRRLIQATDGYFYGTAFGGANGVGTFFRMDPSGGFTTLFDFPGTEVDPSDIIQSTDGNFYGTTRYGGSVLGKGSAFKLDTAGNFTSLWSFGSLPDGNYPSGPLVESSSGLFYGTTAESDEALGTIFSMNINGAGPTPEVTTFFRFTGDDGDDPEGGLVFSDGFLYGTTVYGCGTDEGTVFRSPPGSLDLDTLRCLDGNDGIWPYAALLMVTDTDFYGATSLGLGATGSGTIFRIQLGGGFTLLHVFHGWDGAGPRTALIRASDGFFYGTARAGPFGDGVIYRLSTNVVTVNEVSPTSGPASGGVALDVLGGGFAENVSVTVGGAPVSDLTILGTSFLYLSTPSLSPGTLNDISVTVPDPGLVTATATRTNAFFADFADVPQLDPFHDFVEKIFRKGITAGCSGGNYCGQDAVTRAQMAVFLLKAEHGSGYAPPACVGVFADVACPSLFADWIEQLSAEGITAGCGGGNYCPSKPVTRAQMAVFLLKTEHGPAYAPPTCIGTFTDVACPSLFGDWIEQLAAEQITGGCGGGNYCPDNPNTRAQMSAFLVKTFGL
jgi:uncharacterized repeat protein (TIGR03803 family)